MSPRTKIRYYVHGDQYEENPGLYFCTACILFFPAAHFYRQCCGVEHSVWYERSLMSLDKLLKSDPAYTRPVNPANMIA